MENLKNENIKEDNTQIEKPELFTFAFCGTNEAFQDKLDKLAKIAEPEPWHYSGRDNDPYHILKYYILDTFSRCKIEDKILYSNDNNYCTFNTGLLTRNSQDILALFVKNTKPNNQPWKLVKFVPKESLDYMNHFDVVAELPRYWDNYEDLYYNPNLDIQLNIDHILEDNWDRISSIIGNKFNKQIIKTIIMGAMIETKERIKRNMRLVVPQYYREKIMFLIPLTLELEENKKVVFALAVEKINNKQYRANTIFTLDMAYSKARQLMRPEANWLAVKKENDN